MRESDGGATSRIVRRACESFSSRRVRDLTVSKIAAWYDLPVQRGNLVMNALHRTSPFDEDFATFDVADETLESAAAPEGLRNFTQGECTALTICPDHQPGSLVFLGTPLFRVP